MLKQTSFLAIGLSSFALYAQSNSSNSLDTIIVSASKYKQSYGSTASAIDIISNEEIEASSANTLSELLVQKSSLHLTSNGGAGTIQRVFLRGTESNHTLVLIDGIEVNDPSDTNRAFNFEDLSLDNIERVEILKGSHSTLYGSDAIGGVINIITKHNISNTSSASIAYGSFNTIKTSGNFSYKLFDKLSNNTSLSFLKSDGESVFTNTDEEDSYTRASIAHNTQLKLNNQHKFTLNTRLTKSEKDLDQYGITPIDDPNDFQEQKKVYLKIGSSHFYLQNMGELNLSYAKTFSKRETFQIADSVSSTDATTVSEGKSHQVKISTNFAFNESNTATTGLEIEKDELINQSYNQNSAQTKSFYLHNDYQQEIFFIAKGLRFDNHEIYGNHTTYKIAPGFKLGKSGVLKASLSSGLKSPSLYQLFHPTYGNKNLIPEESTHMEFGADFSFEKSRIYYNLFRTTIKNRLSYDAFTFVSKNAGKAKITGYEIGASYSILKMLKFTLDYTHLKTKDETTLTQLDYRPNVKIIAGTQYHDHIQKGYVNFNYIGARDSFSGSLPSYTLINAGYTRNLSNSYELAVAVNNLLDKDYEEIELYKAPSRNILVTLKMKDIL